MMDLGVRLAGLGLQGVGHGMLFKQIFGREIGPNRATLVVNRGMGIRLLDKL